MFVGLRSFLEAIGYNLFSCLFQILETACTGSSPPYVFKTSRDQVFKDGSFPPSCFPGSLRGFICPIYWEFLQVTLTKLWGPRCLDALGVFKFQDCPDWVSSKWLTTAHIFLLGTGGFHCWWLFKDKYWTLWGQEQNNRLQID